MEERLVNCNWAEVTQLCQATGRIFSLCHRVYIGADTASSITTRHLCMTLLQFLIIHSMYTYMHVFLASVCQTKVSTTCNTDMNKQGIGFLR